MYSLILANFTYISAQRFFANWKTRGLTKPGNKIINHHVNCADEPDMQDTAGEAGTSS